MRYEELTIEGRNAVLEAFRSGRTIDKLFVLDGCQDGPVRTILREARKYDTIINYVPRERLDQISETGKHQGVIAYAAAYEYAEVEDMLKAAEEKGEPPFLILLYNGEGGAVHRPRNPKAPGKSLGEHGFAHAQVPVQAVDLAGFRLRSQPFPQLKGLLGRIRLIYHYFSPFIVREIRFLARSTPSTFTSTTSPTLTASRGCLM